MFLQRLAIYVRMPPTPTISEIVVKIFVEVLSALSLLNKQISQGLLSELSSSMHF
jgi:hypothetical protein